MFKNVHLYFFLILVGFYFPACQSPEKEEVIVITNATYDEGNLDNEVSLNISRLGEASKSTSLQFTVSNGTASNDDYQVLTTSPIIFEKGASTKPINIRIIGDKINEENETFKVEFSSTDLLTLTSTVANITIKDNDDNIPLIPTKGYATPTSYTGYTLDWADEFDDANLDTKYWSYELGDGCPNNCGWGNNELEFYRSENTTLLDGNLVITAKKESFGGKEYTSSRLITKNKKAFQYGRVDIRAALPKGKGLWPALWMLGSNIDVVSWPACGEIDIMEYAGDQPKRVLSTMHYGSNFSNHQYKGGTYFLSSADDFSTSFHVFSMQWEKDKMDFYVDDVLFYTFTSSSTNGATYPFNNPFFFIFNLAVGGNFPGNPDGTATFPQHMIVDYVRVFKKV